MSGPCEWPVSYAACKLADGVLYPEPLASLPASGVEQFEAMATEYLWRWTGQSLGLCTVTIEPCRQDCTEFQSSFLGSGPGAPGWATALPRPVIIDGLWFNVGCGRCGDRCGCGGGAPLRLPGPVASVTSVLVGGEALAPESYYVDSSTFLVRTDGQPWPACGVEITYQRGVPVPAGGQVAAGVLAVQLAKASCGDKTCELPQRVQTVTRQGVTIAMLDAFDDVDKGHTGIWIIDSWLSSMNRPVAKPSILSPDLPRRKAKRRTWPV